MRFVSRLCLVFVAAKVYEAAGGTFGFARETRVASVEDEPMVGLGDDGLGYVLDEFFLDGQRGGGTWADKSYAVGNAKDVCVDGHGSFVVYDALDDVGGLTAYAGQFDEVAHFARYLAFVEVEEHACHADEVAGFVVGVRYASYVLVDDLGCGLSHGFGVGVVLEEAWGDGVDALIGTLGTEYDGYEQLKGCRVVELGLGFGHGLLEVGDDAVVEFFLAHFCVLLWVVCLLCVELFLRKSK